MGVGIIKAGYRFEAEVLTTGLVSLTITDNTDDHAIEVVENGPEVPVAVDRMITQFYAQIAKADQAGKEADHE